MSHYLKLTLIETRPEEMFDTAMSVIDWYKGPEHVKEILEKSIYGAPSITCDRMVKSKEVANLIKLADHEWLYHVFTFRFIFYKEMNLLGLVGDLPKGFVLPEGHNAATFEFQNSSDCDYPLCNWLELPVLGQIVRSEHNLGSMEEYKKSDELYWEKSDEEGYSLRGRIYSLMEAKLHVQDILYTDSTDASFKKDCRAFSLSAIDSEERYFQIKHVFAKVLREAKADMELERR